MKTTTLAIDIAKEKFYLFGLDSNGRVSVDKMIGRKKMMSLISNHLPLEIYMEACGGSNYLCQKFEAMGHRVRRISAQHVKPFVGRQKNDRQDAKAILEACRRPEALFVAVKAPWQQELQSLHKIRDQKVKQYQALVNQIRGILFEYGVVIPTSKTKFEKLMPEILESTDNNLRPLIREQICDLFCDFKRLLQQVKNLDDKILYLCEQSEFFKASQKELKGVGPITASRFLSTIGHHANFKNGRQVSASLGLVPRQYSSGGKTQLGSITKSGDTALRSLLVLGARAVLMGLSKKEHLSPEDIKLKRQVEQKGFNKVAVQLANRNARQMWAIMKRCA